MFRKFLAAACVAAALGAVPAEAGTIVDTGAPVPTPYNVWTLYRHMWIGGSFSVAEDTAITSVQAYLTERRYGEGTLTLSIYEDEGTATPGDELFSGAFTSNGVGFQGLHDLDWMLKAGSYFVVSSVRGDQTFNGSQGGFVPNPLAREIHYDTGYGWSYRGDFLNPFAAGWRIEGHAVPEPATWLLLIGGFALAGAALRRRAVVAA